MHRKAYLTERIKSKEDILAKLAGKDSKTHKQDLTKDSATLTGWRRSQRSGEGKIFP